METTTLTLILRVANGKEALDHSPDTPTRWQSKLDADDLDMAWPWDCILGQTATLMGTGYTALLGKLSGTSGYCDESQDWAITHGFEAVDERYTYGDLEAAWKVVLDA